MVIIDCFVTIIQKRFFIIKILMLIRNKPINVHIILLSILINCNKLKNQLKFYIIFNFRV